MIVSSLLPWVYVVAGLLLFLYLILGGFELMTSGGNKNSLQSGQKKITAAVIGFVIIFVSFWLVQILQKIFGLPALF
jgi:uncharacterized membrane protein